MIPVRDLLDDLLGDAPGEMGNALLALPLAGKVKHLTAGVAHLCGVFVDGSTRCWGGANDSGQLGVGDTTARGPAAALPVNLGAGRTALLDDGTVKCWGLGSSGELGLGNKEQHEKLRSGPACQGPTQSSERGISMASKGSAHMGSSPAKVPITLQRPPSSLRTSTVRSRGSTTQSHDAPARA